MKIGKVDKHLQSISLVHKGLEKQAFGQKKGIQQASQTFKNTDKTTLAGVDLKVKLAGKTKQTDLIVSLFKEESGQPAGEALASTKVNVSDIDAMYSNIHANLSYKGLEKSAKYAIVLSQESPSDEAYFEWLTGEEVSPNSNFSHLLTTKDENGNNVDKWVNDYKTGDAWMKVYTTK